MQLIEPTDAEQAVIDELSARGFSIATVIPDPLPSGFQRVVAVGGIQRDLVTDTPTLVVESFHKQESTAAQNANRMLAILQAAVREQHLGDETAYRLQIVALPQNYPLPTVPSHKRYVFTIAPDIRRRVTTI